MGDFNLKPIQRAALSLIKSDLRYLYTVIKNIDPNQSNYIPSLLPYMGVIVDGVEDWIKAVNNSSKEKLEVPLFNESERIYYEKMRDSIKLWQKEYDDIYELLQDAYNVSDEYFGNICKPIAKKMRLYDIFGVDIANGVICGNTILCYYYNPLFSYNKDNGPYVREMATIGGKYIAILGATEEYKINNYIKFDVCDYGGFVKSPVGNQFSDKFVLFSILCQINFVLYCVEHWIIEEIPAKMRFAYLIYYSLLHIVPQINSRINTNIGINEKWKSQEFRNAMAHYKLGVALKENEIIHEDIMYGLAQKYFELDYLTVKSRIIQELENVAVQIGQYLKLNDKMIKLMS
ncbi:MAG: hypothetical protein HDR05_07360 [Lachnospiraceae bacterium]|nr:hypothetical protein [Lachnospiraceae bacterium]